MAAAPECYATLGGNVLRHLVSAGCPLDRPFWRLRHAHAGAGTLGLAAPIGVWPPPADVTDGQVGREVVRDILLIGAAKQDLASHRRRALICTLMFATVEDGPPDGCPT